MRSAIRSYLQSQTAKVVFFDMSKFLFICTLPLWRSVNTIFLWLLIASWLFISPISNKLIELKNNKYNLLVLLLLYLIFAYGVLLDLPETTRNLKILTKELPLLIFPLLIFSLERHFFSIKQSVIFLLIGLLTGIFISYFGILLNIFDRDSNLYTEQAAYFFEWIYTGWNLVRYLDIHPGYFALMLVLCLSSLLFESNFKRLRDKKIEFALLASFLLFFLIQTGSRIAIVSFAVIVLLMVVASNNLKRIVIASTLFVFLGFILAQFEYVKLKFDLMLQGGERLSRWNAILTKLKEKGSVFAGVGEKKAFQLYQEAYTSNGFDLALKAKYNAHNQFIEFFVTSGLLGVLGYGFVLCYFVKKTRLAGVARYFFITIVFLSLIESFFDRSKGTVYFAFMFCLLIHQYQTKVNARI